MSLPEVFASVLTTTAGPRSEADQKTQVLEYFRRSHPDYQKLQADLRDGTAARAGQIQVSSSARALVKQFEEPMRDDPALVQLRRDVQQSAEQLNNRRLTAAQDLAWALINSPAFLFN